MVKICSESYPKNKNVELFEKYSFELSSFQKHAIEGIVDDKHVLITAHTGSGKTMPAEFAIEHFVAKGSFFKVRRRLSLRRQMAAISRRRLSTSRGCDDVSSDFRRFSSLKASARVFLASCSSV